MGRKKPAAPLPSAAAAGSSSAAASGPSSTAAARSSAAAAAAAAAVSSTAPHNSPFSRRSSSAGVWVTKSRAPITPTQPRAPAAGVWVAKTSPAPIPSTHPPAPAARIRVVKNPSPAQPAAPAVSTPTTTPPAITVKSDYSPNPASLNLSAPGSVQATAANIVTGASPLPPLPVWCMIKLKVHMGETNVRYMFRDTLEVVTVGRKCYFKHPSLQQVRDVVQRINGSPSGKVHYEVDENVTPPKNQQVPAAVAPSAETVTCGLNLPEEIFHLLEYTIHDGSPVVSQRKTASFWLWRSVLEICKDPKSRLAIEFRFNLAVLYGSISPDILMTSCTKLGCILFTGFLCHVLQGHLKRLSWGGDFSLKHLLVGVNNDCAIAALPDKPFDFENMQKDINGVVSNMTQLYIINRKLPPYFDSMILISKSLPPESVQDEAVLLSFWIKFLNSVAFATDDQCCHLLQEFFTAYNNPISKESFDNAAPKSLEDWRPITKCDSMLTDVIKEGSLKGSKFGAEGSYLRHLTVHLPDKKGRHIQSKYKKAGASVADAAKLYYSCVDALKNMAAQPLPQVYSATQDLAKAHKELRSAVSTRQSVQDEVSGYLFSAAEKIMVVALYFSKYLPMLVDLIFERAEEESWLKMLRDSYQKDIRHFKWAPLGSVCYVVLESEGLHEDQKSELPVAGAVPQDLALDLQSTSDTLNMIDTARPDSAGELIHSEGLHEGQESELLVAGAMPQDLALGLQSTGDPLNMIDTARPDSGGELIHNEGKQGE
ncbi:hypothetical protein ACQJBY_025070 [Aegilops geniculata]